MDIGWTLNKNPIHLAIQSDITTELNKLSRKELEKLIKEEAKFIINLQISLEHILLSLDEYPRNEVNKHLMKFIDALLNGE